MPGAFDSAKGKLERAKIHVRDFGERLQTWIATEPHRRVTYEDLKTREEVTKFICSPLPADIANISADAIFNLRAALDQATFATAFAAGAERRAQFPIAKTLANFNAMRNGLSKHVPPEIFSLLAKLNPYEGGDGPPLWILHELCNAEKHRFTSNFPITGGGSYAPMNTMLVGGLMMGFAVGAPMPVPIWNSSQDEVEVLRVPAGTQYHANFSLFVSFDKIEVGKPIAAAVVLNTFVKNVGEIIASIERKADEISLFN